MYLSNFFFFFAYAPVHMVHIELIRLGATSLALLPNSDDAICPFCFCFIAPLFFPTYQDKTGGSQDVTYLSYAIQIHKNGCHIVVIKFS